MNILLEVGILATIVDSKNEDYTLGMAEEGMERNPRVWWSLEPPFLYGDKTFV